MDSISDKPKEDQNLDKMLNLVIAVNIALCALAVTLVGGIIYVAIHSLSKIW